MKLIKKSYLILLLAPIFAFGMKQIQIASYNTENFFDALPKNGNWDYNDTEWTPERGWTQDKFKLKAKRVAEALLDLNNGNTPDIIGLAEIESLVAIQEVNKNLGTKAYPYYSITQGPDVRGINVAVLSRFPFCQEKIQIHQVNLNPDNQNGKRPTRPILSATVCLDPKHPVTVMMNHWPSRLGGQAQSEPNRIIAATELRRQIDALAAASPGRPIVSVGDYNDEPEDRSMYDELQGQDPSRVSAARSSLYNLSLGIADFRKIQPTDELKQARGTYYFNGEKNWDSIDQMIVSKEMLTGSSILTYIKNSFKPRPNSKFLSSDGRPVAFSVGKNHSVTSGLSDHLPIAAEFILNTDESLPNLMDLTSLR